MTNFPACITPKKLPTRILSPVSTGAFPMPRYTAICPLPPCGIAESVFPRMIGFVIGSALRVRDFVAPREQGHVNPFRDFHVAQLRFCGHIECGVRRVVVNGDCARRSL